jgi:hypothetical protein
MAYCIVEKNYHYSAGKVYFKTETYVLLLYATFLDP